jgi:hypothetical protein
MLIDHDVFVDCNLAAFVCFASQKRPARLCFSKQSVYELGTLAYRIVTGSAVSAAGADLPTIPDPYPLKLHALLPRLVAIDPGEVYARHGVWVVQTCIGLVVAMNCSTKFKLDLCVGR